MGELCGFILCNSKYQQPSLQFQRLRSIKADIRRERRVAGLDTGINEALAAGNFALTLLLAGLDIRSADRLRNLHPIHRELITIHAMQHAACMRFGLFRDTDILREDVIFAAHDNALVMYTTWRKTEKSNRPTASNSYSTRTQVHQPAIKYRAPAAPRTSP